MTATETLSAEELLAESVVEALGSVVASNRSRLALVGDDREITYTELWDGAAAVASLLGGRTRDNTPHVAVLMEQGIDAIVALLGVMRAGLAYVALDPMEPPERLRFICEDAQATVLLTNARNSTLANDVGADLEVIDVATVPPGTVSVPDVEIDGYDPILVVYTSGSTGQPKGVIQTHRNEVRYSASFAEKLGIGEGTRLSMLFSLSFGASNTDIYGGLLAGATLCLYDTRRLGVVGLPDWIAQQRIEVLHAVPTVFRYLAEHVPEGGYPTVRAIELAGEPVFRSDVRRAREAFDKNALVVNRYAATEVTILAQYVATADDEIGDGSLPAGLPPDWVDVLILDENGQELPPDSVGQLVIRSSYLSPGYWQRPEMTGRAFVDDPQMPDMRRYLSGDAGRRDANGLLTVLGRLDSRVKIRGQSIEPAEVEGALRNLPGVREAIIDVESDGEGAGTELRLVGYVVAAEKGADGAAVDAHSLRAALADRLPQHMLPSRIRVVDSFPMLRSGKVDRMALRQLPNEETAGEAPQGEAEKKIADIYSGILGVPVTSRDDDFFALGGTSMTLAQLQVEIRREFARELALGEMIRSATVADVARSIGIDRDESASPLLVPLRPEGSAAPLFLVHGWHGQAFVTRSFLDAVPQGHPVHSIQARGLVDGARPHRSVSGMAREYVDAIATVGHPLPPIYVGICAGGVIAVEMARQSRSRGEDATVIMLDPPYPPYRRSLWIRFRDIVAFSFALSMPRVGAAKVVAWRVARQFRVRAERLGGGGLDDAAADIDNDAALRVALSVGVALRSHRPTPYRGPVHVIASERRLARGIKSAWLRELTGEIEFVDVGETHSDALDPNNPRFRAAMASVIDSVAAEETLATASSAP